MINCEEKITKRVGTGNRYDIPARRYKTDKNVCFDEARRCAATAYAGNISTPDFGTYLYGLLTADYEKPCSYYTRTPSYAINDTGEITDAYQYILHLNNTGWRFII